MPRKGDEIPVYAPEVPVRGRPSPKILVAASLILVSLLISYLSVYVIDLGYAAVTVDPLTGYISDPIVGPRIAIKMPWQSLKKVYVASDAIHMWTDINMSSYGYEGAIGDYPAIETLTKDGLQAWVDLTVRWHISPSSVPIIVKNYPAVDYRDKLLVPSIRQVCRNIVSNYEAAEVPLVRGKIGMEIFEALQSSLSKDPTTGGGIIIDEVYIRNIRLPSEFLKAIQEKLTSQQRMIAAYFERNRTLILANASATAKVLGAEGEAKARLILVNATAKMVEILASRGAKPEDIASLIIYVEGLKDISRSNATIIVASGGNLPIIYPVRGGD
ncbi:MAG: prohibitin family protein [Candidatus Korarchaeum sp.]|nr:prohibitin family protein [Candidatus Korarchaeum sp.]MDW8035626.1 prohibitin family protein [Candidatus Korarchaeum sp.]